MHTLGLYLLFTLVHIFVIVYSANQSAANRHTPWRSTAEYFGCNWPDVMLRWLVATVGFFALLNNPWMLRKLVGLAYAPASAWIPETFLVAWWVAMGFGLAADKAADLVIAAFRFLYRTVAARFA